MQYQPVLEVIQNLGVGQIDNRRIKEGGAAFLLTVLKYLQALSECILCA